MANIKKSNVITFVFATQGGPDLRGADQGPRTTVNKLWRREMYMAFFLKVKADAVTKYGSWKLVNRGEAFSLLTQGRDYIYMYIYTHIIAASG